MQYILDIISYAIYIYTSRYITAAQRSFFADNDMSEDALQGVLQDNSPTEARAFKAAQSRGCHRTSVSTVGVIISVAQRRPVLL